MMEVRMKTVGRSDFRDRTNLLLPSPYRTSKQDHNQCTSECISTHNLNVEQNLTGSQCRPRSMGVMCSSASDD